MAQAFRSSSHTLPETTAVSSRETADADHLPSVSRPVGNHTDVHVQPRFYHSGRILQEQERLPSLKIGSMRLAGEYRNLGGLAQLRHGQQTSTVT